MYLIALLLDLVRITVGLVAMIVFVVFTMIISCFSLMVGLTVLFVFWLFGLTPERSAKGELLKSMGIY